MSTRFNKVPLFEILRQVIVFLIILTVVKSSDLFLFGWNTAPALMWPTTGLALGILWRCGYRYALPIFLGLLVGFLTGPFFHEWATFFAHALVNILGPLVAIFLLRRSGFEGDVLHMRSLLSVFGALVLSSLLIPLFLEGSSYLLSEPMLATRLSWQYIWIGHLLSSLLIFPLFLTWTSDRASLFRSPQRSAREAGLMIIALSISIYLLFWIPLKLEYAFFSFAVFFSVFFWIIFRFSTRTLTITILFTAVGGVLGLLWGNSFDTPLNERMLTGELFMLVIIPILYVISTLVKKHTLTIERLKNAMEKIERESVAKNEFIAVLAHELRNPLAPIKSTLEILDFVELDPETKNLVTRSQQQVRSMQRLLSDLLDITRVTQGKFQLKVSPVLLHELVQHCIDATQYVFKAREHTIIFDPSVDPSLQLVVDPVRFEQVLVNLLMNAAKYTDPGGTITVTARLLDGRVELAVKDTGIGIEKEHIAHVFEPFWQLSKSDRSLTGIGVGLWLTKRIVEMHGGEIRAESEGKGKGSRFIVTIPILHMEPVVKTEQPEEEHRIPCLNILICDDNEPAADALRKLLTLRGHEVMVVYSGTALFEAIKDFDPDLILLDIGLPDMTGYEIAQKLRAMGFKKKIAAVSGYGQEEDKRKALRSGFDYHFTKPISLEVFERYLREHL